MTDTERVLEKAKSYIGYLEKNGDNDTYFNQFYERLVVGNWRKQPWCAMFVSTVFAEALGISEGRRTLFDYFAYTPAGASRFKVSGAWISRGGGPKPGDVIFFRNRERICHVGIVTKIENGIVSTIEGNSTSQGCEGVFRHFYSKNAWRIAGYGRPNYRKEEKTMTGWTKTESSWNYHINGELVKDRLIESNGLLYYMDGNGDIYHGQRYVGDKRYVFCDSKHPFDGAAYLINDTKGDKIV